MTYGRRSLLTTGLSSHEESADQGNDFSNLSIEPTSPAGVACSVDEKVLSETTNVVKNQVRKNEESDIDNFCTFSNSSNNGWINASFQGILNLNFTRKCLSQNPQKFFESSSATPLCASLISTAVHNPGKYFSPLEMSRVQVELRESELSSDLGKDYQTSNLLEAILDWLNSSDRNMDMLMNSEKTCVKCKGDFLDLLNSSPLVILPALPFSNIASLFKFWMDNSRETHCSNCKSVFKRKHFLSNNEAIVLFLRQSARSWSPTVIPNATLDVPGQSGNQLYHLSSIICSDSELTQFYTYLIRGQQIFKADDDGVRPAGGHGKQDIHERGFVYIYEK